MDKTDSVLITQKKCNNTWGQGVYEHTITGHYTKCVTLCVSVNKYIDHIEAQLQVQYSNDLGFVLLVSIHCISFQNGRNREVMVSLFTCLLFQISSLLSKISD